MRHYCVAHNSTAIYEPRKTNSAIIDNIFFISKFTECQGSVYYNNKILISSAWLPMKTVDLGVPMLAMHSARELIGVKDQEMLVKLAETYFTK